MNKIYRPCNLLCPSSSTHHQSWGNCGRTSNDKIQSYRPHFYSPHLKIQHNVSWTFHSHHHFARHSINGSDSTVHGESDSHSFSAETEGSVERKDGQQERLLSTTKILEQLKRYGISGVLSYGLLNTAYYLTTFLLVWFYFAPATGKMGYLAAVSRFLQVMAMVWAGSQVTKLIRAAGYPFTKLCIEGLPKCVKDLCSGSTWQQCSQKLQQVKGRFKRGVMAAILTGLIYEVWKQRNSYL